MIGLVESESSCLLCPLLAYTSAGLLDPAGFLSHPKVARSVKEFAVLPRKHQIWKTGNADDGSLSHRAKPGPNQYTPQEIEEFIRLIVKFVHGRDQQDRFRLIDTHNADFDAISEWLKTCATHSPSCGYDGPILDGARVIDCETRQVVRAERSWRYLALSYVWGSKPEYWSMAAFGGFLPQPAPAVIEDAITATRRLGFRYLWVDRYCIPQDDIEEKFRQIRSMNHIYSNAFLTIIAAAGTDPSYGLPGVGERPRTAQRCERIGEYMLFSELPHPRDIIAKSHWASRGWTYQEDVLSRRRLVFTEKLVYYECQVCSFSEDRKNACERLEKSKSVRNPTDTESTLEIFGHLSDFTSRQFSVESDILHGIAGIFKVYQQNNWAQHYWGVPILSRYQVGLVIDREAWGRLNEGPPDWGHTMSLVVGLFWDGTMMRRRPGFPSWSWSGWVGRTFGQRRVVVPFRLPFGDVSVFVQCKDGALVEWESFVDTGGLKSDSLDMSPFLHLSAWTLEVSVGHFPTGITGQGGVSRSGLFVKTGNIHGEGVGTGAAYSLVKFTRTGEEENYLGAGKLHGDHRALECILFEEVKQRNHFRLDNKGDRRKGPQALLVAKVGDHYERLGHFEFAPVDLVWTEFGSDNGAEICAWELERLLIKRTVKLG
ncbi:heterokaryon incompatibility protein-domain-containing protein [Triangularia verruculosa]|uniref:Heterokaryon incompatibility protein-domain-containing protein n=1 Tax=Triangularia verruculosa TaxID=2587418 RepID=A0AAN6XIY9_9PEZI|nr:heterokaryon incompatibility protein-domain-containing protein [Triangularia verruculosa]